MCTYTYMHCNTNPQPEALDPWLYCIYLTLQRLYSSIHMLYNSGWNGVYFFSKFQGYNLEFLQITAITCYIIELCTLTCKIAQCIHNNILIMILLYSRLYSRGVYFANFAKWKIPRRLHPRSHYTRYVGVVFY